MAKIENALEVIKTKLSSPEMQNALSMIAPKGFNVDVHTINALNVVKQNLKDCNNLVPSSVLNAVYNASSIGLSFNPMKKEAYLVPFNCKISNNPVAYGTMVTFIPGYKGIQKLCINAGMKSMTAKVVFVKDRFVFNEMDGEVTYEYSPSFDKDRGEPVCVLTVATMQDGTKDIKVLPYHKVLEIKAKAKSQGGPWATYEEEMAMKTAVRRHCNQLPQSLEDPALAAAITIDELAEAGKTSFHTPEGMESIVDADYESVVDSVQNAEAPQSTKPVVSAPKLAEPPKQPKSKPETKKPSSNLETLMNITGKSKEAIEATIFAEWEVRDVNAVDDSTFSGIFDSFANGLVDVDLDETK